MALPQLLSSGENLGKSGAQSAISKPTMMCPYTLWHLYSYFSAAFGGIRKISLNLRLERSKLTSFTHVHTGALIRT